MQKIISIILIMVFTSILFGCDTPGTYMGPMDMRTPLKSSFGRIYPEFIPITPDLFLCSDPHREYRVGAQDILTVIVWNHPELTIPSMQTTSENVNVYNHINETYNNPPGILVNKQGEIFFPLAGKIHVSKKTVDQIRQVLTAHLRKFIRRPQVSVRVSVFRSKPVYVIGEVMKSGIQYITDVPMTIMDAINQAGGIDKESSDARYIYVIRGSLYHPQVYWLNATTPGAILMAENFQLRSKDILMVSTAGVARYARVANKIIPSINTLANPPIRNDD